MPGAYTHITIARLLTSGKELKKLKSPEARKALLANSEYCQMGAIGPDYPYLKIMDSSSEHWANAMHHKYGTSTEKNIFHVGVQQIKNLHGDQQSKCLAWFYGYISHVIADVTCHPVTNILVGDYEADNQIAHRESEVHQDVYIFKTRLDGDVRKSEHIKNVIGSCVTNDDNKKINYDVEMFWRTLLVETFPKIHLKNPVNINGWHNSVQFFLDNVAEELSLVPSRHVREYFAGSGIAYPRLEEVDKKRFIDVLKTPKGNKSYDQIFDLAMNNVMRIWQIISDGIFQGDESYKEKIRIWNLDNGEEINTSKVMWEGMP